MSRPAACHASCPACRWRRRAPRPGLAKDYLLTGAKPDKLVLVDPAARKVEKSLRRFRMPAPAS